MAYLTCPERLKPSPRTGNTMRSRSALLPAAALAAFLLIALAGTLSSAQSRRPDLIEKIGVDACPRVGEAPMPIACVPQTQTR